MKKTIFTFILMMIGVSMLSAGVVGLFTATKGKVSLSRNSRNVKFKNGDMLYDADEIRTGKQSFAAYKYIDGSSTIKVFANSYVKVSGVRNGKGVNKTTQVNSGSVYAKVTPGRGGTMTVQTPTSVASVKGTGFLTKVNSEQEATYIVTEGVIELKVMDSEELTEVKAGQTAFVDKELNVQVRDTTEEDLDEIEQAEIEAAQNYVPKKVTIQVADEQGRIKYIEITY